MVLVDAPAIMVDSSSARLRASAGAKWLDLALDTAALSDPVQPWRRDESLVAWLGKQREQRDLGAFAITGPFLVRPGAETPMATVYRLTRNLTLSGWHHLLTRGPAAQALPRDEVPVDATLPMPPVIRGTGKSWGTPQLDSGIGLAGLGRYGYVPPRNRLAIWLEETRWTVGRTVPRPQRMDAPVGDVDELIKAVEAWRKEGYAGKTRTIDIAASPGLAYQRFAEVVAALHKVGFDRWRLVEPGALPIRVDRPR